MFENKVYEGIHYSRFIASWFKSGGKLDYRFKKWLQSLKINDKEITEEIIREIYDFAENGKLELQETAKAFLDINNKNEEIQFNIVVNLRAQSILLEHAIEYAERARKFKEHGFEEKSHSLCEISKELIRLNSKLCGEILEAIHSLQKEE